MKEPPSFSYCRKLVSPATLKSPVFDLPSSGIFSSQVSFCSFNSGEYQKNDRKINFSILLKINYIPTKLFLRHNEIQERQVASFQGLGMGYDQGQSGGSSVIGNGGLNIPMMNSSIQHTSHIAMPEWMVMMDDLLSSTVTGTLDEIDVDLTKCCELLGWYSEQARLTKGNTVNQLFSTAAVQHSSVLIAIPVGNYVASLENNMNSGTNIAVIELIRLANMTDLRKPLQCVTYTNCLIESVQQQLDKLILSFRPETRQNTIIQYSQDGVKQGQNVSYFDYTTGSNDSGSGDGSTSTEMPST
jgi:hypothetical protein